MSSSHGELVARVAHPAPQVDHLLAPGERRAGGAELAALGEVALELAPDPLEARRH